MSDRVINQVWAACVVILAACAPGLPAAPRQVPLEPAMAPPVQSVVLKWKELVVEQPGELLFVSPDLAAAVSSITIGRLSSNETLDVLCNFPMLATLTVRTSYADSIVFTCAMSSLQSLTVSGRAVRSIDSKADLTALVEVNISDTSIPSLDKLPSMPNVRSLVLNSLSEFQWEQLRTLTNLESLSAKDTGFSDTDLEALVELPLKELDLAYTSISEMAGVAEMSMLETLSINGSPLRQGALRNIPASVRELSLVNLNIEPKDLGHLQRLSRLTVDNSTFSNDVRMPFPELTHLSIRSAKVKWLSIGSARLRFLDATDSTQLERVVCPGGCSPSEVRLSGTALANFPETMGVADLSVLSIDSTDITDLNFLSTSYELRELSMAHTAVSELGPISAAYELKTLDIRCTAVRDLSPVSDLSLAKLVAAGVSIADFPSRMLQTLTSVDLYNSSIQRFSGEIASCMLQDIDISYTALENVTALGSCPELDSLQVCGVTAGMVLAVDRSPVLRRAVDPQCRFVGFIDECL